MQKWECSALLISGFTALLIVPQSAGKTVLPLLSERFGLSDTKSSTRILSFSMMINAHLLFPVIIALCIMSPFIMGSYGDGFRDSWATLVVVVITAGLVGIQIPVGQEN